MGFNTHFLVIGHILSWRGLNLLLVLFHLVNSFFLTNKYGGGLGILIHILVSFSHLSGEKDDNNMNMTDEVCECEKVGHGHA